MKVVISSRYLSLLPRWGGKFEVCTKCNATIPVSLSVLELGASPPSVLLLRLATCCLDRVGGSESFLGYSIRLLGSTHLIR